MIAVLKGNLRSGLVDHSWAARRRGQQMKIVCDSCGAKYSIADEKVAGKIFKIRCKKCSSVLEVRGDQTGAHPFGDAERGTGAGGEPTWYIVVDGEQKGPSARSSSASCLRRAAWASTPTCGRKASTTGRPPETSQSWRSCSAVRCPSERGAADDTSSFGTGGDLFSDRNGREPTSEIDTSGNMFAGFDESPTPTGSEDSPLAAAASDSGASVGMAGLGGGASGRGRYPERMTGQRNENSVLFSLSNLQQLASRGGSPPTRHRRGEPAVRVARRTGRSCSRRRRLGADRHSRAGEVHDAGHEGRPFAGGR